MSASTTTTTAPDRPRRRLHLIPRTRKGRIGAAVALLVAIPAVAWALYLLTLPIVGNVSGSEAFVRWRDSTAITLEDGLSCSNSIDTSGPAPYPLTLTASGYPGGLCEVTASVEGSESAGGPQSSEPLRAVGVTFDGPAGWDLALAAGECGATIQPSTPSPVVLNLTSDPTGPLGSGPITATLDVVPDSQFDTALCTP